MCLTHKDPSLNRKCKNRKRPFPAFKVVYSSNNQFITGDQKFPLFPGWNSDLREYKINYDEKVNSYLCGFHCFLFRSNAEGYICSKHESTLEVWIDPRSITTVGTQGIRTVVVARRIFVGPHSQRPIL